MNNKRAVIGIAASIAAAAAGAVNLLIGLYADFMMFLSGRLIRSIAGTNAAVKARAILNGAFMAAPLISFAAAVAGFIGCAMIKKGASHGGVLLLICGVLSLTSMAFVLRIAAAGWIYLLPAVLFIVEGVAAYKNNRPARERRQLK